ncbi:MAG TPA: PAS domain S-box protein [Candidatus Acidoferrum sp.]|nr:PAS domain S-box protein [Candidatus Acidoferrum sp.]
MHESEKHYRDLVENSLDLMCTHDLNGVLLTINRAAARTLGYEPGELVNRNLREFLSPEVRGEVDAYLVALRERGASSGFMKLRTKSGETRIWKYTNSVRTEGVDVPIVRGIAHDLTDIFLAQKALREGEERLRIASEVGRMYAWEWDSATDSIRRSSECARILGLDAGQQGCAKDYFVSIHPDDRAGLWTVSTSLTPKKPTYRTEYRRFRPDGALLWLEESGRGKFDESGKMVGLVGMTADITERKQVEEALRESEERLRLAIKAGRMYAFEWDTETDVILRSEQSAEILNWIDEPTPDTGRQFISRVHPDDRESYVATETGPTPDNPTYQTMYRMLRPDGSAVWLEECGHAFFNGQGRMLRIIGMVSDITDRKQAEEALASVSRRLIEAQEQERTRIARELHDDIGQRLALLTVELEQLRQVSPDLSADLVQRINKLSSHSSDLASDVQFLSHELHSSKLEYLGLATAMSSFCKEFSDQQNAEVVFTHNEVPRRLPQDISLCLFRILQEALQNALKHSGVRHFDVELCYGSDEILLTARDSGSGFESEAAKKSRGLGLISMEERLKLLNGTFSIESRPQRGTTIHARVPLSKVARAGV